MFALCFHLHPRPDFARPRFTPPDWFTTHHALVLLQHGPGLVGTYQVFTLLLFLQAASARVKRISASLSELPSVEKKSDAYLDYTELYSIHKL